jgi:hypothetical protein
MPKLGLAQAACKQLNFLSGLFSLAPTDARLVA